MPWCSTPTRPRGRPSPRPATRGCGSSMPRSCGSRTWPVSPELGVIASMQPSHASDDLRWADARLGPDRVDGAYAWRWFVQAGVTLAHGSDFPVEIVNPFWGIYAGITRQEAERQTQGRLASRAKALARRDAPRLHLGCCVRGIRRRSPGHPQAGLSRGFDDHRPRPLPGRPGEVLASRVVMTVVDGTVAFERPVNPRG